MIQYQMCSMLGYSLREYRTMTPGEISEQVEAHINMAGQKPAPVAEDSFTEGVSF